MKDKFYFYEVGFRRRESWDKLRQNINKIVESRPASLELDKNNKSIIQGTYVEQDDKIVTTYDIEGNASKMALPNYLKCDFLISRERNVLIVKNPKRAAIRNIVSMFEDATDFEMFVEAKKWDLGKIGVSWCDPENDISILRVDVESLLYSSDIEAFMRLEGNINLKTINSIKSGKLVQLIAKRHGGKLASKEFSVHSSGVFKFAGSMSFENIVVFFDSIKFKH